MPGKAFLTFSFPSLTDKLIITWAKHTSILTYEGQQSFNAPHPVRDVTIVTLSGEMYQFKYWSSTDGITLGTMLLEMSVDTGSTASSMVSYDYVVDRGNPTDPVAGGVTIVDSRLIGASSISVTRRGVGPLRPDEFTFNKTTGTIDITPSGDIFYNADTWIVSVITTSVTAAPAPLASVSSFMDIPSGITLTNSHIGNILNLQFSSLVETLDIPNTLNDGLIRIITHDVGSGNRYAKLAFGSAGVFLKRSRTELWLGPGEEIEIMMIGGVPKFISYRGLYELLGLPVWGRKDEIGRLKMDGSRYTIADLGRFYTDFVDQLPTNQIVSESIWAQSATVSIAGNNVTVYPNKGFFTVEGGMVRVPDKRGMFNRALIDGSDLTRSNNFPGGFQNQDIISHNHGVPLEAGSDSGGGAVTSGKLTGSDGFKPTQSTGGLSTRPDNYGYIAQYII